MNDNKTEKGLYKSKIKASKKYDSEKVDTIRLRVPKGWKEKIESHIQATGHKSMNSFICSLIKNEIGIE